MNGLYDEYNRINEMLPLLKEPNSNSCNKWQIFLQHQVTQDDNGNAMEFIGIPNTMNTIDYEFTTVETSLVITL
ncbi:hypothetical protein QTP88_021899 [Uroleucon formosanum]